MHVGDDLEQPMCPGMFVISETLEDSLNSFGLVPMFVKPFRLI